MLQKSETRAVGARHRGIAVATGSVIPLPLPFHFRTESHR